MALHRLKPWLFFIILKLLTITLNLLPFNSYKKVISYFLGFRIGKGSVIHSNLRIFGFRKVNIGKNSVINSGCYIDNRRPVIIGDNVSISHDVKIYTLGHDIDSTDFELKGGSVFIKDYACIFPSSMIMPGVTIGKGAVVYPGSVVTKDIGDYAVVGGNPAKYIRQRYQNLNYKLDYKYWFAI